MPNKLSREQLLNLGRKVGVDFKKIPLSEFTIGLEDEAEHKDVTGGDLTATARIAHAHLKDNPIYYTHYKNRLSKENWTYVPPEVYIKRLPQYDKGKFKAWAVDGEFIRNFIFLDFTQGGNPARYKYVKSNELWVDHILDADEQSKTINHEHDEFQDMLAGLSYSDAHDRANVKEGKLRNGTVDTTKQYDLARHYYRPEKHMHKIKITEIKDNHDLTPRHNHKHLDRANHHAPKREASLAH